MITEKEHQITQLSATKKDYYQIWAELLDTARKLSERWDPTTTNESDPGIILLKVLTGIADKLNYNIDKNALEAFMPSAAQEESMRKLCEMMGYAMKYYRSATTDVTVYFAGKPSEWQTDDTAGVSVLVLPEFTQFTNIDKDIVYTTTEQATFTKSTSSVTIPCIEGIINYCEEDNNGIITMNNIDDNNRYYLPITQVAENGVFIYNITDNVISTRWEQVDNLNSQELQKKIYKFGYDSKRFLPYIEFPSDISSLIEDGLSIAYIASNGLSGNISARTLTRFETSSVWKLPTDGSYNNYNTTGVEHTSDEFKCYNASAATNGTDKESLNNAYKNFKKTIGTFDTLVTCRDYMNKIYTLTTSYTDTTPLVSNSIISDIRDDINKAIAICSFDDSGINYLVKPLTTAKFDIEDESANDTPAATTLAANYYGKVLKHTNTTSSEITYYKSVKQGISYIWGAIPEEPEDLIDNFDLILYPFQTLHGLNTKAEYGATFKNTNLNTANSVIHALADFKTISHNLQLPENSDIMCIKNYLRLNAKITTINKVTAAEWSAILDHIKTAIYTKFNCRQLDFSEVIPFDDILDAIQNADVNIKNVSLEEPDLYTAFMTADNKEYLFETAKNPITDADIIAKFTIGEKNNYTAANTETRQAILEDKRRLANEIYNKLAIRNILAGRVCLFNYNTDFKTTVAEQQVKEYDSLVYPQTQDKTIVRLSPKLDITAPEDNTKTLELSSNQIIQFRAPNFKTTVSYPAYVNYYLHLNSETVDVAPKPATFNTLSKYLSDNDTIDGNTYTAFNFSSFMNKAGNSNSQYLKTITTSAAFVDNAKTYGGAFSCTPVYLAKATNPISGGDGLDATNILGYLNYATCYFVDGLTVNREGAAALEECSLNKNGITGHIYKITNDNLYYYNSENENYQKYNSESQVTPTRTMPLYIRVTRGSEIEDQEESGEINTEYGYLPIFGGRDEMIESSGEYCYDGLMTNLASTSGTQIDVRSHVGGGDNDIIYIYTYHTSYNPNISLYYIYPMQESTYAIWFNWIKQQKHFEGTSAEKTTNGLYRNLGGDQSRNIGYMVDTNKNKYQLSTTWYTITSNPLLFYNVPIVHYKDKETVEADWGWTADGFGKNAVYSSLTLNTEYQLKTGEYLCINYTNATSSVGEITENSSAATIATTSEVVNTYYDAGTIIKPNFSIRDSAARHEEGKSYSKQLNRDAYNFSDKIGYPGIEGLFSLGTDEQIDIREPVTVLVYAENNTATETFDPVYVYFNLNNERKYDTITLVEAHKNYILEEGEYFWYTDKNKQTLTYCGAGCEIENHSNIDIKKSAETNTISTEDIFEQGLTVIPWIPLYGLYVKDPENPTANDNYLQWNEYQYINLIAGDTLLGINEDNTNTGIRQNINNTWTEVGGGNARYICDGENGSLPKLDINSANAKWEVRSKLAITISPGYFQTLTSEPGFITEQLEVYTKDNLLTPFETFENVSLKSNYVVNSTADNIDTTYNLYNENSTLQETIDDFKLKIFKNTTIYINEKTDTPTKLILNNINGYYTSLACKNYIEHIPTSELDVAPYPFVKLYSTINNPNTDYNLFMIYYQTNTTDSNLFYTKQYDVTLETTWKCPTYASIRIANSFNNMRQDGKYNIDGYNTQANQPLLTIYNNGNWVGTTQTDAWWTNRTYERTSVGCGGLSTSAGSPLPISSQDDLDMAIAGCSEGEWICWQQSNGGVSGFLSYSGFKYIPAWKYITGTSYYKVTVANNVNKGMDADTLYSLRPGINIIKIKNFKNAVLEIYAGKAEDDVLIFGQLDTITQTVSIANADTDMGINLKVLQYSGNTSMKEAAAAILKTISALDTDQQFYYNTPLDNSLSIDINELANETLSDEQKWYDYNNINNKFVISEIDSDYLDTGLTLARSSIK